MGLLGLHGWIGLLGWLLAIVAIFIAVEWYKRFTIWLELHGSNYRVLTVDSLAIPINALVRS